MWSQIVVTLIVLVIATYVIQLIVPRTRGCPSRTSARWDVAPLLGFFGAILLALSLAESLRERIVEAWAWGVALGVVLSVVFWIAWNDRAPTRVWKKESALLATFRFLRSYGLIGVGVVVGLNLAARIFGPMIEVFAAGAIGVVLVAIAVRIFVGAAQPQRDRGS